MTAEMEVGGKRGGTKERGVKKTVQAQEGQISSRGSECWMEMGNRNGCYSVGKVDRGRGT